MQKFFESADFKKLLENSPHEIIELLEAGYSLEKYSDTEHDHLVGIDAIMSVKDQNGIDFLRLLIKKGLPIKVDALVSVWQAIISIHISNTVLDDTIFNEESMSYVLDILPVLSENNIKLNGICNDDGDTFLIFACKNNLLKLAESLLSLELVDINEPTAEGISPLLLAIYIENMQFVQMLCRYKCDLTYEMQDVGNALTLAATRDNADICRYLAEQFRQENIDSSLFFFPLAIALQHEYIGNFLVILENCPDVNIVNPDGLSVLHCAASRDNLIAVKALIQNGANISLKSNAGQTPLEFALTQNASKTADFLYQYIENKSEFTEENLHDSYKVCPFCAEDIKKAAIVCKHCGRDLLTERFGT